MYTKIQRTKIYALILAIAAVAIMASCNGPDAHANTSVAGFTPLGACDAPYDLEPNQTQTLGCNFLTFGGIDKHAEVLATVTSGHLAVSEWTVFAGVNGPTNLVTIVFVSFAVHNNDVMPVSGVAHVTAAISPQTTTPAVGAAGVE